MHKLEKKGAILQFKSFRCACYCTPSIPFESRTTYALLHHPKCRGIILHLLRHEGRHCAELASHTAISKPALSYYLRRLRDASIITDTWHGKNKCIHLRDSKTVRHVIECSAHRH
ncbi:winged helix-turn-helix transcriptional regulator [Candidatus Woesearchaeota archaeon]|nr:winged helix-turn-helix transcriptional regulator [Candidatus Woesearchaeota archaeon]